VDVALNAFSKKYAKTTAVSSVSFNARQGEITGLLGPNGSGKTTILKAIAAIHFPTEGFVHVHGMETRECPERVRAIIGYAAENAHLYPEFTVREILELTANITVRHSRPQDAVEKQIAALTLGDVLKTRVAHLSKGYAQRVTLALSLLHDPPVLVLDEPASALDPAQIHELRSMLKRLAKTKTIILSTHLIAEADLLCSVIHIMQGGCLVASGTRDELLRTAKKTTLEQAYLALTQKAHTESDAAEDFHA